MKNSGKNLYLNALKREENNIVPVTPIIGHFAGTFSGYTIKEFTTDPEIMAESLLNTQNYFGYDAIYIAADTWINAGAMGCEVNFPENSPAEGKQILDSKKDLSKLKIPDPSKDGRWPLMLEAAEIVCNNNDNQACIIGNIDQSPFTLAGELRGIENLMIDLKEDPDFVFELLDICSEAVIAYGKAMAKQGVQVLNTGDSLAQLIGPKYYQKFALPYEKKVFKELKGKTDLPVTLHICGDTTKILEFIPQSMADGFEVDHAVELQKAFEIVGGEISLIGNIDPVDILNNKTPDVVKKHTKDLLKKHKNKKGFVLASGCTITPDNPEENIKAMVNAAREFSQN